jgi:hypothetical protein
MTEILTALSDTMIELWQIKSLESFAQSCTLRLPPHKDLVFGRPSLRPDGGIFQLSPGPADPTQPIPSLIDGGIDSSAVIQPGASATFCLSFCPRAARTYSCSMQLFLRRLSGTGDESSGSLSERESGTPYMIVQVSGEGSSPAILFDRNEVKKTGFVLIICMHTKVPRWFAWHLRRIFIEAYAETEFIPNDSAPSCR